MHHLGIVLQLIGLTIPPVLIFWQLTFGFRLIVMPACLLVAMMIFGLGTRLREKAAR